jgi:predicted Zn-dependent peptidase
VKRLLPVLTVLAVILTLAIIPAAAEVHAGEVESYMLDNGLKVVLQHNDYLDTVTVGIAFKTGRECEVDPQDHGLHFWTTFFMTAGTNRRPYFSGISRPIEEVGGTFNYSLKGSTTLFYAKVTTPNLYLAVDTIGDVARNPSFDKSYMEYLINYYCGDYMTSRTKYVETSPYIRLREGCFGNHPYGYDHIGTTEALRRRNWAYFRKHYQKYFIPNNAVLLVTGNFESKTAKKYIAECFGSWKAAPEPPKPPSVEAAKGEVNLVVPGTGNRSYVYLGYRVPGIAHEDGPALAVLNAIWGQGLGSHLFQELRSQQGLAYECSSSYKWLDFAEPSMLYAYVATAPQKVTAVQETLRAQAERFRNELVSDNELASGKAKFINNVYRAMEDTIEQVIHMGFFEAIGMGYDGFEQIAQKVRNVTAADVQKVAQKYFVEPVMITQNPK